MGVWGSEGREETYCSLWRSGPPEAGVSVPVGNEAWWVSSSVHRSLDFPKVLSQSLESLT